MCPVQDVFVGVNGGWWSKGFVGGTAPRLFGEGQKWFELGLDWQHGLDAFCSALSMDRMREGAEGVGAGGTALQDLTTFLRQVREN